MKQSDVPVAERVLAVARSVLLSEGSAAVTMRRIAAGAGLTTMATYRHFTSRQHLLEELARREFAALAANPVSAWDGDPAKIGSVLNLHLDLAISSPELYAFLFTEPRHRARTYPSDIRAGRSPTLSLLAEGMLRGRDRGILDFDDEWELALIVAAQLHGLTQLRHGGRVNLNDKEFRDLCMRAVRVVLCGVRA